MGLTVTLITGPRQSGKTTVVQSIIEEVAERPPFYLRLALVEGGVRLPTRQAELREPHGAASAEWLCYERDRIFELLPETLAGIYKRDRRGRVLIEADSDPTLRHAYPYDQQVFVMRAPRSLGEVFRTPHQAARALQDALDDTSEFAAEVFGLTPAEVSPDEDSREERDLLSKSQIKRFLDSPLGEQLASQIQLQAAYQGLVESDIALVNTAFGPGGKVTEECCRRLEQLVTRMRGGRAARRMIYCCNPQDREDGQRGEFLEALRTVGTRR